MDDWICTTDYQNTRMKSITKTASEIKKLHGEICCAARTSLDKAIRIGELLADAKGNVKHGEWLSFVKTLPFSERTARNYMRVYEEREGLKSATVADLTEAYRLLEEPKTPSLPSDSEPPQEEDTPHIRTADEELAEPPAPPQAQSAPPPPVPPAPAPMQSKPQTPAPEHDKTNWEIPWPLVPLWNRGQEARDLLHVISGIRSALKQAQESGDVLYAEVNFSSALANLDQCYADVKRAVPFAVCPTCQGQHTSNCTLCKRRGLISQFMWDICVPVEMKNIREKLST